MKFHVIKGESGELAKLESWGSRIEEPDSRLAKFADSLFDADKSRCVAALVGMPLTAYIAATALAFLGGALSGKLEKVPESDKFAPSPAYQQLQK